MDFKIGNNTKVVNDTGLLNTREFVAYGINSYKGKTVNIVKEGDQTLLVSTGEFPTAIYSGIVNTVNNSTSGKELTIWDVKEYNETTLTWVKNDLEYSIKVLENSIIIKNGKLIGISDIEKGDSINVYSVIPSSSTAASSTTTGSNKLNSVFIFVDN
jgi:hypothetical protein